MQKICCGQPKSMQTNNQTYNLTFTAGALLMNETCAVAEVYLETGRDWEITKDRVFKENLMEKEKVSTNRRFFSLVKQRIEALNEKVRRAKRFSFTFYLQDLFLWNCCSSNDSINSFLKYFNAKS